MPAKTEKVQVLHHLEACAVPMTTQTDEPVAYIIDANVSSYVLSPIPDNLKGTAEMVLGHLPESSSQRSKVMLLLWILFVIYVSCFSLLYCLVCSLQPCDQLLGKS